jgi:hypothetical protein
MELFRDTVNSIMPTSKLLHRYSEIVYNYNSCCVHLNTTLQTGDVFSDEKFYKHPVEYQTKCRPM